MELKIEYLDVDQIKPYKNNAKIHTEEQIAQIKESITQFGMNDPIAIWKDNEIIEGHGRLQALKELGYTKVPVIRLDNLTDQQRKAYALVHNQLTMSTGFDKDLLKVELEDIDIDMSEFGLYLDDLIEEDEQKEDAPEIEFTEVLGEEHNYIVLYFDNEIDWLQATSLFDISPKRQLSTRQDGKITESMKRAVVGRVLNGAKALEEIRRHYEG